ncbi:uncharacterized protein LOC112085328 [Eutrema salsugineum]|uniref:uncharacterized protein LOC112085328 n=1 Tax=Eutrema salsugineum TaxID=72664 RepID=UPI000CED03C5|nr:uncharacterized protein LOC112085328 [Eutrema salsugineum]
MDMPSFSGSFGYYMLARMLRVKKKHKLWFLFAGHPVRFSLRKFALVTGLEFDSVVSMLQKKKISDKEKRFKCACLAVTAAVLVPTSHVTKIVPEHVELIRDIDAFLSYPWGRVGFDLLVSSIKSKDELELSQKTISIKGFFYAIQLVMMAAVPTLTEVVQAPSGESDSDCEDESDTATATSGGQDVNLGNDSTTLVDGVTATGSVKMMLSPSHAREIDEESKAIVHSIIPSDGECALEGMDLRRTDEVPDEAVDLMIKLIGDGFFFSKDMLTGGLSAADLVHMRTDKVPKEKESKDKKKKDKTADSSFTSSLIDQDAIADLVVDKLKPKLQCFNSRLGGLEAYVILLERKIVQSITGAFKSFQDSIMQSISQPVRHTPVMAEVRDLPTRTIGDNNVNQHPFSSIHPSATASDVDGETVWKSASKCGRSESVTTIQTHGRSESVTTIQTHSVLSGSTLLTKAPALAMSNDEFLRNLIQSINAQLSGKEASDFSSGFNGNHNSQSQAIPPVFSTSTIGPMSTPADRAGPIMDLLLSVSPSFSLGLTQEDQLVNPVPEISKGNVSENDVAPPRKSKRVKTSSVVYKDYQCLLTKPAPAKMNFVMPCDPNVNYSARFVELKAKLAHDRRLMEIYPGASVQTEDVIAIGERVRVLLSKYAKFSKTAVKDRSRFKFQDSLMSYFESENPQRPLPDSMYFPFNFNKRHWVGVCVNIPTASIMVLECNVSFRSDSALKREFTPICNMFSFIVRAAGTKVLRDEKPYTLERALGIPQNEINSDSAVTAVILMQAHASAGLDVCRTVTPDLISSEAFKFAIMFCEEFGPNP